MKTYLTTIYLLVSLSSLSQRNGSDLIHFEVTCGSGAQTSKEIKEYRSLHMSGEITTMKEKLIHGNDMEKVLSSIILTDYYETNSVDLTADELETIGRIKNSKKKFSLCFTCTFHEEGTLKQLFKQGLDGLIKKSILHPH